MIAHLGPDSDSGHTAIRRQEFHRALKYQAHTHRCDEKADDPSCGIVALSADLGDERPRCTAHTAETASQVDFIALHGSGANPPVGLRIPRGDVTGASIDGRATASILATDSREQATEDDFLPVQSEGRHPRPNHLDVPTAHSTRHDIDRGNCISFFVANSRELPANEKGLTGEGHAFHRDAVQPRIPGIALPGCRGRSGDADSPSHRIGIGASIPSRATPCKRAA